MESDKTRNVLVMIFALRLKVVKCYHFEDDLELILVEIYTKQIQDNFMYNLTSFIGVLIKQEIYIYVYKNMSVCIYIYKKQPSGLV